MLLHLIGLALALLLVGWFGVMPLRRRNATLQREVDALRADSLRRQAAVDTMLGQLKDMVVRMDRQGRVLWANPRAEEMLPLPAAGDSGADSLLSMVQMRRDPDWGPRLKRALRRLPELTPLPVLHLDNNGSGQVVSFSLQLLPLGDDQSVLLCNDITESLQQQQQRDALFVNLMHDLKTPLTSLIGYSNTLTTLGENKQVREEATAAINRAAKRVNRLLDGLMALANSEAGAGGEASCDAAEMARLVVEDMADSARRRQVRLVLQADEGLRPVAMAPGSFERVLFNVVENAVLHAPEGSAVTITLRDEGAMLRAEVADHGCGVPNESIPRLTERFYRLDDSRSKGGHGLGLAIVAEQLQQCGGTLEISNHLPSGLLVTMRIPFLLPDAE